VVQTRPSNESKANDVKYGVNDEGSLTAEEDGKIDVPVLRRQSGVQREYSRKTHREHGCHGERIFDPTSER
jgi:hypothetical protein